MFCSKTQQKTAYAQRCRQLDDVKFYIWLSTEVAIMDNVVVHFKVCAGAGCTHFIIGRDMAGSKSSVSGEDFYGAYDAQDTANKHAEELHMQTVPSLNITYTEVILRTLYQWFTCSRHLAVRLCVVFLSSR